MLHSQNAFQFLQLYHLASSLLQYTYKVSTIVVESILTQNFHNPSILTQAYNNIYFQDKRNITELNSVQKKHHSLCLMTLIPIVLSRFLAFEPSWSYSRSPDYNNNEEHKTLYEYVNNSYIQISEQV